MFLFVFIGAGTAMANGATANGPFNIALAFGFAIFVLASAIGHHSGGQMNCAVTLCLCICGDLSWVQGIYNLIAQADALSDSAFLIQRLNSTGG